MASENVRRRTAGSDIGSTSPLTVQGPGSAPVPPSKNGQVLHPKAGTTSNKSLSEKSNASTIVAASIAILSLGPMFGLIFGGCCSNVYALEAIIKAEPDSGNLISFTQFFLVAVAGYYSNFTPSHPPFFLKPTHVPLSRILMSTALFWSVNTLNNYAFGFQISVPVHIILRSGGSLMTMIFGYIWGKRYSRVQVLSVALLTFGVVLSAWADADAKGKTQSSTPQTIYTFCTGLAMLFIAQMFSAWMGLYVEATYRKYGNHWQENFFYSHLLSMPLFIPFLPSLWQQLQRLAASDPLAISPATYQYLPGFLVELNKKIPSQVLFLSLNSITQYACIRGVNLLASQSTALTVTIVLNIRKLASLLLSIWLFGNNLASGILAGATIVFGSGALYGWESQRVKRRKTSAQKENGYTKEHDGLKKT